MTRNERELKAVETKILELSREIEGVWAKTDEEDRSATPEESADVEQKLKNIRTVLQPKKAELENAIKVEGEVKQLSRDLGPATTSISVGEEPHDRMIKMMNSGFFQQTQKTIGEQFVDSASYRDAVVRYKEAGRLPSGFSTGVVETLQLKGTLAETAGYGGGAIAAPVPQVIPGVVDKLFQPLVFADLLLQGQANTNSIRYVVEGTASSGAAGVAEMGSKPQSTLGLTTTDETIKKIATSLKIADEMIEDAPAIQSYVNGRLVLFVRIEEERQLIRGAAGGAEVQGLLTSRSVPIYGGGTAAGNRAVQLFKAMNGLRGSAFLEPEWTVIHPSDWEAIRLLQDTAGQFLGGGPFVGPYGGPQGPVGASGQVTGPTDQLWGKPVYVTAVVGSGTAIVGTRSSAQIWRRGGLSVEATNSNEDDFLKNLLALRAEERLGLTVYRPTGFVQVNLA